MALYGLIMVGYSVLCTVLCVVLCSYCGTPTPYHIKYEQVFAVNRWKISVDKVGKIIYNGIPPIISRTLVRYFTCDIRTHEHTFAYHNFQLYPVKLCQKIYHNLTWYRLVINWHNCPRGVTNSQYPLCKLGHLKYLFSASALTRLD